MKAIGILMFDRKMPGQWIDDFAKFAAEHHAMKMYSFSVMDMKKTPEKVNGYYFRPDKNIWEKGPFFLPPALYLTGNGRSPYPVISKLNNCPALLNPPLPDRLTMNNILKTNRHIAPYLLISEPVHNNKKQFLPSTGSILFIPAYAPLLKGLFFATKEKVSSVTITTIKKEKLLQKNVPYGKFRNWLERITMQEPYLSCHIDINPVDEFPALLRSLWQKNSEAQWIERATTIVEHTTSTEMHVLPFPKWLETKPVQLQAHIQNEWNELMPLLLKVIDTIFSPVFELEFTFLITQKGAIWIVDISAQPDVPFYFREHAEIKNQYLSSVISQCLTLLNLKGEGYHDG